ncbi:hypothetical protein C1752_04512 [Acaryochloris thomasi RCC1774]|uniref:DUF1824 domain-containing protein n=1 Tax=Acaryochloris thomasi RCC1774 TaxID=1764569 RepID=A0A2W1JD22_9CYAN|nr:DUF1824 family protein [Acaryochloris thomasi]PZD71830.1 hypothetical protein C1752_04512 [Acaryochloris thomasi RCC1774]
MTNALTLQQAHDLLVIFETESEPTPNLPETQAALCRVIDASDDQILGILASTFTQGISALNDYAKALGHSISQPLEPVEGPIYIKFNPQTNLCYCESYTGEHRGVLVSCQSAVEGGLNHMYGHLPLDLWA